MLLRAGGLLDFIAMNILSPLPKLKNGSLFVLIMTNRYSMLISAVPTSRASATHIVSIFHCHGILPHGIPACLLTDNGTQFVRQVFEAIYNLLGLKLLTTTAYCPRRMGSQHDIIRSWSPVRAIK